VAAARHRRQWTTAAIVSGAFLASLAVRIMAARSQALTGDEWFTLNALGGDVPALIRERLAAGHSPLYFLLLKGLGLGPDASNLALRLPSATVDSLTVALLTFVAAKISGRFAAFAFATMAAMSPALIAHGQVGRPYALLYFFLAVALAGALMATRAPSVTASTSGAGAQSGPAQRKTRAGLIAMALGLIGAGYTLNLGIVAAAVMPAAILVLPACRADPRFLRLWLAVHALVWLALLPGLIALAPAVSGFAERYWTELAPGMGSPVWILLNTAGYFDGDRNRFLPADLEIVAALAVAVLAALALVVHRNRPPIRLIAFCAFALPAALAAIGLVQSLLIPRYFFVALWPVFLLAADGAAIVALHAAGRIAILILLAAIALQGLDATFDYRINDWRRVTTFLDVNSYGVIRGITNTRLEKGLVERHAPPGLTVDIALEPDSARARERIDRLLDEEPFIWILLNWQPDLPRPDLSGLTVCAWHFADADILVAARDRNNLPHALQACGPDNGSLTAALRAQLSAP
jgi:hypothetical protein